MVLLVSFSQEKNIIENRNMYIYVLCTLYDIKIQDDQSCFLSKIKAKRLIIAAPQR